HQVRDLQEHYTYKNECLQKYGKTFGHKIWDITNTLFDGLPVCAVVDDRVFCAHGGIPRSVSKVEDIGKVAREIRDPQHESAAVWEMLWSDPCHMQQFYVQADLTSTANENLERGFIKNVKRGTAFLF